MTETTGEFVVCENLMKIYKTDETEVVALSGLDLTVARGELMAIIGNSGSGKSTLLNMLGGLDRPSAGSLLVDGKDLLKISDGDMVRYKRETVGFVWQNNARNLIPYLSAVENVEMPMLLNGGLSGRKRRERARELLTRVGLEKRRNNRLHELSGGEQQRVAIAIALANSPKLLLADEPTGSVDTKTTRMVLEVFRELSSALNLTVIIVTHDMAVSRGVDRVVAIRDGRTSSEFLRKRSYREDMENPNLLLDTESGQNGGEEHTHEELAVIDKAGRVQIPRDYLEAIGLTGRGKVKIDKTDTGIVITSPKGPSAES